MNEKILIIEDEQDINALVSLNLQALDYEVTSCDDGLDGFDLAVSRHFDLIILDLMLPRLDGIEICRKIREKGLYMPILMLTARKSEQDRVLGLEVGADDYLTKPFGVRELQARVKALLRRVALMAPEGGERNAEVLHYEDLTLNKEKRQVNLGGREIRLTGKEFDLLYFLAKRPGRVFSRDELLDAVWGYQHSGYEHTVNSHINRLRSKLEDNPAQPKFVLTVWGVGYKFYEK